MLYKNISRRQLSYFRHLQVVINRIHGIFRTFQRFVGLSVTGVLDNETRAKIRQPRCGVPDVHPREDERDSQSTTRRRARMRGPQGFFLNGGYAKSTEHGLVY